VHGFSGEREASNKLAASSEKASQRGGEDRPARPFVVHNNFTT
jgi:hypothetical protein